MVRALLVEDDPQIRKAFERGMRSAGACTHLAATLADGLAQLAGGPYDLAIVDLDLPDGSGIDLLRAVRLGAHPIPIAIISGRPDAHAFIASSGERPDAIFLKPVDLAHIIAWATNARLVSPPGGRTLARDPRPPHRA